MSASNSATSPSNNSSTSKTGTAFLGTTTGVKQSEDTEIAPAVGTLSQLSQITLFVDESQEAKLMTSEDPDIDVPTSLQADIFPDNSAVSRSRSVNTVNTMSTNDDDLPNLLTQDSNAGSWAL